MKESLRNIIRAPLEDVMHDSFMPYAEYVILERAIPRVEDGLKPVQRHILYAMHEMQILPSGSHKKCARIVGETMGKYHPHGDSSIYEALARMAQGFSMNVPLIDGQGNFGSIDGDSPAAMRYTEARLTPIALEMLRDIDKGTVPFQLNFDDTLQVPTILPSRFPNLLVNGSTGIAVGLATNIPPHNLREVIDAVVLRIQKPGCTLREVMGYIKGPDFPTGGVLLDKNVLASIYETGRGTVTLRAKLALETPKNGKTRIVITELPYEVRESSMLRKIQELRTGKKELFAGISDVRSETDRTGVRAVIELRNGADPEKILDCLYKYSSLQISYGINMVTIADGQPKQLGLLDMLDYYIAYQKKIVTNRVQYDKEAAEEKEHKLQGLIRAVLNIDKVIKIIRSSEDTRDAKSRLMKELAITGVQAQAILDLRLARLTRLEVITLEKEYDKIVALLKELTAILRSKEKLHALIIKELSEIREKYGSKRRTPISSESGDIVIDHDHFRTVEDCVIILTKNGTLKRMSKRAFSKGAENGEIDYKNQPLRVIEADTDTKLRVLTSLGNLYAIDAEAIREAHYKNAGSPLGTLVAGVKKEESIVNVFPAAAGRLLFITANGKVKYTDMAELDTKKSRILACGLEKGDTLLLAEPEDTDKPLLLLLTKKGMSICFGKDSVPLQGKNAKGVGGIQLAENDAVCFAFQVGSQGNVVVFTDEGFAKQSRIDAYTPQKRYGKGAKCMQWAADGSNGSALAGAFYIEGTAAFEAVSDLDGLYVTDSRHIPLAERASAGKQVVPVMGGEQLQAVYMR